MKSCISIYRSLLWLVLVKTNRVVTFRQHSTCGILWKIVKTKNGNSTLPQGLIFPPNNFLCHFPKVILYQTTRDTQNSTDSLNFLPFLDNQVQQHPTVSFSALYFGQRVEWNDLRYKTTLWRCLCRSRAQCTSTACGDSDSYCRRCFRLQTSTTGSIYSAPLLVMCGGEGLSISYVTNIWI